MLVQFTFSNFRAARDEQALQFTRAGGGAKARRMRNSLSDFPDVSPVAAILGVNAAGKSASLEAMRFAQNCVLNSFRADTPVVSQPFLLDAVSAKEPSAFEFTFDIESGRYEYGFEIQDGRFTQEWLLHRPRGSQNWRRLFERETTPERTSWRFGSFLRGKKKLISEITRPNGLFLATAAQLNHDQLGEIYSWFVNKLRFASEDDKLEREVFTSQLADSDPKVGNRISELLRHADLGISDLQIVRDEHLLEDGTAIFHPSLFQSLPSDDSPTEIRVVKLEPRLRHAAGQDSTELPWATESQGTRNLYQILGPVVLVLREGSTLVLDEIDGSLHPQLVRVIVELFQTRRTNPLGAQLIFSTHDVTTLGDYGGSGALLERDQIWFAEKDSSGAMSLTPLTDYRPRLHDDLETGYIIGRYSAAPVLDGFVEILDKVRTE